MGFKSNNDIFYDCQYHVVWCVKYRRKVLADEVENRLKEILYLVAQTVRCKIEKLETSEDHVQLLLSCDPQFGIHQVVKRLKGRSSRLLREEFPFLRSRIPSLWTNSYFVASIGDAPLSVIEQYISDQKLSR